LKFWAKVQFTVSQGRRIFGGGNVLLWRMEQFHFEIALATGPMQKPPTAKSGGEMYFRR
jgi:hypothetical protein